MFGSGDFGGKSQSLFLKIFKNTLGQFIPNRPPKHVITSTNSDFLINFKIIYKLFYIINGLLEKIIPMKLER